MCNHGELNSIYKLGLIPKIMVTFIHLVKELPEQKKAHRLWVINSLWISEAFLDHQPPPTNFNTCITLTGIIFRWQICWKTLWPLQKAACFDLRVDAVDGSGVFSVSKHAVPIFSHNMFETMFHDSQHFETVESWNPRPMDSGPTINI